MPALPTGKLNGIAVLDVDRKNGKDGFEALRKVGHDPNELSHIRCDTPSGGAHFYFEWPEGLGNSATGLPSGVDVRGEGGFVIAAGAVAPSGKYEPGDFTLCNDLIGLACWPSELLPKRTAENEHPEPSGQSVEVLRSALMAIPNDNPDRDWWLAKGAALHFETSGSAEGLEIWHEWSATFDGYDHEHTEQLWLSFKRKKGKVVTGKTILAEARKHGWHDPSLLDLLDEVDEAFELDEDGVIRAFTSKHKDDLRFNHMTGKWFRFDDNAWRQEETKLALHYARKLATRMAEHDPKAKALRKVNVWEAIERGAKSVRQFATTSQDWNRNPLLLGTPGGTVDLCTGELRPGDPNDLISRLTAVAPIPLDEFDPVRDCPLWMKFLNEALAGDAEAIRFLQMWGGYSLTGVTKEHALVFVYGPGGSGKSTAINTMADIIGEYATNMATSTLTATKHDAHPEELARLDGARMAWASETEKGRAWAENRIKSLTGGDKITARNMRQNSFEFTPQMKLVIVGNNQPSLTTVDDAIKRRFIILPFDHPPKVKDPDLPNKLRAEWPGILSWMIQGCLDWQANGLIRPEIARRATESYFDQQDVFGQWLEEHCMIGKQEADTTTKLWDSWQSFAYRQGEAPGSRQRTFPETLSQRGFEAIKNTNGIRGRGYRGLSVIKEGIADDFADLI